LRPSKRLLRPKGSEHKGERSGSFVQGVGGDGLMSRTGTLGCYRAASSRCMRRRPIAAKQERKAEREGVAWQLRKARKGAGWPRTASEGGKVPKEGRGFFERMSGLVAPCGLALMRMERRAWLVKDSEGGWVWSSARGEQQHSPRNGATGTRRWCHGAVWLPEC